MAATARIQQLIQSGNTADLEDRRFQKAEAALKQAFQAMPTLTPLAHNLLVDETPEGLRIQMVDQDNSAMFAAGSADPMDHMRALLAIIQQSIGPLPNPISIRGYTDSTPYRQTGDHFNNWDLSALRANAARRMLEQNGLNPDRIVEVVGKADKDPLFPDKPSSAQNRRISITLLRAAPPAQIETKKPPESTH